MSVSTSISICYEKLVHMILEAKKSNDMLAVFKPETQENWWCNQPNSEDLRTRAAGGVKPSLRAEDEMYQDNSEAGKKGHIPHSSSFCYIQSPSTWRGPSNLLSCLIQMLMSARNTLTDTHRSDV